MAWDQIAALIGVAGAALAIIGGVPAILYHVRRNRIMLREEAEKRDDEVRERARTDFKAAVELEMLDKELKKHMQETQPIMDRFFRVETQLAVMVEANRNASENLNRLSGMAIETQRNIGRLIEMLAERGKA